MISDSTEPKPTSPIIPTPPPIQSNTSNKKSSGSALPRLPIKLPQFTLSDHKQKSTRSSRKKSLPSLIIEPPRFSAKASNKTLRTDREYHPSKKPNPTKKKETKPLPSLPVPLPTSASTEKDTWKKRVTKLGHYLNPLKKNSKKGLVRNSVIVKENTNPSITVEKYLSNQENVLDLSKRN